MRYRVGFVAFWVSMAVFPALALAQESEEKESYTVTWDSSARYLPARSLNEDPGRVAIVESESEFIYDFMAFGKLPVSFTVSPQYIGIDSKGAQNARLPPSLTALSMDIEATLPFFNVERTYALFAVTPSFYSDRWDFDTHALRVPFRLVLAHMPSDKWTLIAGVAVFPQFKEEYLPVLGFIYKPNSRLTFNIVPNDMNISYALNDKCAFFLEGDETIDAEYQVKRDGDGRAILQFEETSVGGGVRYRLTKNIDISASGGYVFNRLIKYRDGQGKADLKNGLYSECRVEIRT